ncbi:MAG TPA: Fe-S protein assembly co-chaperone HscB [Myxococcales bacterium]|jgi:molecular chaperone HscB|nr:Fe-S protein assembly co-chaperone HscB [Myxococcales bacterium]
MTSQAIQCWSCGKEHAASDALCPHCGKVQAVPARKTLEDVADKFAALGFARSYDLHPGKVEEAFKSLSRKLHPDRFARASAQERRFSLEQTTLLNDAYRTLKDPVRRAEHLLELRGVKMGEGSKVELPPEFLERALEDREKLLEAKVGGGPQAVGVLAREVQGRRDATLTQIAQQLRALESGSQADLAPVTQLISQLRYYARYLDEVEGRPAEP